MAHLTLGQLLSKLEKAAQHGAVKTTKDVRFVKVPGHFTSRVELAHTAGKRDIADLVEELHLLMAGKVVDQYGDVKPVSPDYLVSLVGYPIQYVSDVEQTGDELSLTVEP